MGHVTALWRYPVKSMRGESRDELVLDRRGVVGDRLYAVRDEAGKFGSGKTTRRFCRIDGLFAFSARYDGDVPVIELPDGAVVRGDDPGVHASLTRALGQTVTLAREAEIPHFDAGPVHLITRELLAGVIPGEILDERRFRPNLVLDLEGLPELGAELAIGAEVRLRITSPTERCTMIGTAQSELADDPRILRELAQRYRAFFGVYAEILAPGRVRVGDPITRA